MEQAWVAAPQRGAPPVEQPDGHSVRVDPASDGDEIVPLIVTEVLTDVAAPQPNAAVDVPGDQLEDVAVVADGADSL
jgi:hypothetical protein